MAPARRNRRARLAPRAMTQSVRLPASATRGAVCVAATIHGAFARRRAILSSFSRALSLVFALTAARACLWRVFPLSWWTTCQDSVGQTAELLAELERSLCFDPRRVYATGVSNGGVFLYELAISRLASSFAAFMPIVGCVRSASNPACPRAAPVGCSAAAEGCVWRARPSPSLQLAAPRLQLAASADDADALFWHLAEGGQCHPADCQPAGGHDVTPRVHIYAYTCRVPPTYTHAHARARTVRRRECARDAPGQLRPHEVCADTLYGLPHHVVIFGRCAATRVSPTSPSTRPGAAICTRPPSRWCACGGRPTGAPARRTQARRSRPPDVAAPGPARPRPRRARRASVCMPAARTAPTWSCALILARTGRRGGRPKRSSPL